MALKTTVPPHLLFSSEGKYDIKLPCIENWEKMIAELLPF